MVQRTAYALITSYSVEGIFLGMNCVLYGFCAYMLWGQKFLSCRLLLIINTVQFLLCAVQVALYGIFLFLIFTLLPGDVQAYLHHVNGYILAATIIYSINFITGGLLSMWRLYVLYDNLLKVCFPAFIMWIGQICASGLAIFICATVPLISTGFNVVNMLLWAFITALNLCVAVPILFRLCIAQKRTRNILSRSPYKSIAIIMVECGALVTLCSMAMLIFYARNFAYALASLGIATEAAVASQLLITARHAMLSQGRHTSNSSPTASEINPVRAESRPVDVPMTPVKAKTPYSFAPPSNPQDKKGWQPLDDV